MQNGFRCTRRRFLQASFLGTAAACTGWKMRRGVQARPKLNIVYINVDDLGWTDLSCQGSEYYETRNIDALASQGMVFTNAYATAANCAPSRACAMTGQYTPRHGVYTVGDSARGKSKDRKLIPIENTLHIREDNLTIAHVLHNAGYRTCTVGKWHLSEDPLKNGFDVNVAGGPWGSPSKGGYHSPYNYPNCTRNEKGEYLTDRLTTEAIAFVEENKDRPFFLYLPFYTVHRPLQAKASLKAEFAEKDRTKAHKNPTYAAMIASLDENVGRLMAALEKYDIADDTLVLFSSDNGAVWKTSKQWPLRAGKGSYYEGGIREPMIVRWPVVVEPGTTCDTPVSNIDFFPTFIEAAGVEKPREKILDGESLVAVLTGRGTLPDRALYWHFPIYLQAYVKEGPVETRDPKFRTRPGSVVRYGDWKLHEYFEDGGLELYNLREDVGEKHNLAEERPEKRDELHAMLKHWREELGAPVPTELNPEYEPEG
ncbi:MAG: sulfatase [Candidatus Hydrogenedentota bacterium]